MMGKSDNLRIDSLGVGGSNSGLTHKQVIRQSMKRGEIFHSTGTGLSDLFVGTGFTGIVDTTYNFVISEIITGIDKFKWRKKTSGVYGVYSGDIAITGLEQTIEAGIIVKWGATTGHTLADEWTVTFTRINALQILDPAGTEVFTVNGSTISSGLPDQTTHAGQFLTTDGTDASWGVPAGSGDVTGPAGAVAGNVATLDATGKILSDGGVAAGIATGFSPTAGKTLSVQKTITLTCADDTAVATLPAGAKTLLATDGTAAAVTGFSPTAGKTLSVQKTMTLTCADDTAVATLPAGAKTLVATDGNISGSSGSCTGNAASATTWGAYAGIAGPTQARTFTLPDANATVMVTSTDLTANTILNPAPADHAYSGMAFTATAGDTVALGDVCYLKSDGKYYLAKADVATTKMPGVVMATAAINANATGVFLARGFIRDDSWSGWTVGGAIYVTITGTTTNTVSHTAPSATGNIVQDIGYAYAAKVLFFDPNRTQVEVA